MELTWGTCGNNGSWCNFFTVNLNHPYFSGKEGVYIIWQSKGPIIRVGQGVIKDRLLEHRREGVITAYSNLNLFVTWAVAPVQYRDGIEHYLAEHLNPIVGERFPNSVSLIRVNLPFTWPY